MAGKRRGGGGGKRGDGETEDADAAQVEDAGRRAKARPRQGLPEALSRPPGPDASPLPRNHRTAAARTVDEETG